MEPDELEDYFSDKFSSISVKTSGTLADIASAVVNKPFFGLKEGDTVAFYLIAGKTPFDDLGLENNFAELKNAKLGGLGYEGFIDNAIELLARRKKVSDHEIKAVRKALDPNPANRQKSVDEFLLEYQFEAENAILRRGFEKIQYLLNKTFDTNSNATPIEIVDAFLYEYEKVQMHKQKYNLRSGIPENVRSLLEQRADKDYDSLRKYLDTENGRAKTDLPSKEKLAERKRYVQDLFMLIYCWGNSVRDIFVSDKTISRIRQGAMNKEFFERWYQAYFK